MSFIEPNDLALALPNTDPARIAEVIEDAEAFARVYAPCIDADGFTGNIAKVAVLRAVLRTAIIYNVESGNGAVTQESAGSFSRSVDTTVRRSSTFYSPSQQDALRNLCSGSGVAVNGVYSIRLDVPDTLPGY